MVPLLRIAAMKRLFCSIYPPRFKEAFWMSNENEKIVKEMSNNSTNVEDLFGDQPIMNQDLKSNSESTVLKRSVFTQP